MRPQKIYTYDAVWGLKRMFYHIERFRLPVPVSVTELLIIVLMEVVFTLLTVYTTWAKSIPEVFRFVIFPFGTAWLMSRLDLEGRPPYQYLYSVITHALTPKHWSKGVPIPKEGEREETHQLTRLVGGIKRYAAHSNGD
jgi:hypothetical protein